MIFSTVGAVAAADSSTDNHSVGSLTTTEHMPSYFENPSCGLMENGDYFSVTLRGYWGNCLPNKEVEFSLLNETYTTITDDDGVAKFKLNVPDLDASKNITVKYKYISHGDFFESCEGSSNISVKLTTQFIDYMPSGTVSNNGYNYNVTLKDANGKGIYNKCITFDVYDDEGNWVQRECRDTDMNGVAKLYLRPEFEKKLGSTYKVYTRYIPYQDEPYYSCNCTSYLVVKSSTIIGNTTHDVHNGDTFNVTLKDDYTKTVLANRSVHINVLGNHYDVTTDDNGVASIKLGNVTNKDDKPVTIYYSFRGDDQYLPSNDSVDVNAHRIDTSFSNASSTVTNGSYFNVTLKDSNGNPLALKKVRFTLFYDEFYNVVTDANGVAHLRLNVTDKDMNDIMVQYYFDGDDNYKAANGYTIINVTDNK